MTPWEPPPPDEEPAEPDFAEWCLLATLLLAFVALIVYIAWEVMHG